MVGLCFFCIFTQKHPPVSNSDPAPTSPTSSPKTSGDETTDDTGAPSKRVDNTPISFVQWSDIENLLSAQGATEFQQREWERLQGKKVSWTGTVVDVIGPASRVKIKMNPRRRDPEVILRLVPDEFDRAARLQVGQSITFVGVIDGSNEVYAVILTQGKILR